MNQAMTGREWGLLLTLSLLWGGAFLFNGVAVREVPVLTIVVVRVGLAAVTLWAVLAVLGQRVPAEGRLWLAFLAMGLLNNVVPFSLIVWGQQYLPSGVAAILNATTPLFTVLTAHAFTSDEKISPARLIGMISGFIGVAVIIEVGDGTGDDGVSFLVGVAAPLACLGAAVSYAFAGVFGRRFRNLGVTPMGTAAGQVTASTVLLLPAAVVLDQPWTLPLPGAATLASLGALATLSTALAYILYFRLLATAGATNLLLVTLLIPVSASLFGFVLLGEVLEPRHIQGMALIGLGLVVIDGRAWRFIRNALRRTPGSTRGSDG